MPTCPAGHNSASTDFCDICGMRIGAEASLAVTPAQPPPPAAEPTGPPEPCPRCQTARSGRFCEACGFDFEASQPDATASSMADTRAAPASGLPAASLDESGSPGEAGDVVAPDGPLVWTVVVASDRAYYETVLAAAGPDAASLQFPGYCPERQFRLAGPEMRIGRHSASRGLEPEIDLTGPPTDPGISRLHAILLAESDGSWVILDPGSENGTLVNGREIAVGVRTPLRDGDRVHLGAWTAITIHAS